MKGVRIGGAALWQSSFLHYVSLCDRWSLDQKEVTPAAMTMAAHAEREMKKEEVYQHFTNYRCSVKLFLHKKAARRNGRLSIVSFLTES